MENFYDKLLKIIKRCVIETSYERLKHLKCLVIIAINDEGMNRRFMQELRNVNFEVEIIFVMQPGLFNNMKDIVDEKTRIIEWKGAYTSETASYIKNNLYNLEPDGFAFFGDQPINLRNRNLIDIAEIISQKTDFHIFSVDFEGNLYEYRNITVFNQGLHLYAETNLFIESALNAGYNMED